MAGGKLEIVPNDPRVVSVSLSGYTPAKKQELLGRLMELKNIVSIKYVFNGGYGADTIEVEYAILDLALQMGSISTSVQDIVNTP